jgi:protocatechuate 3,4-dioxygenase beta subunit
LVIGLSLTLFSAFLAVATSSAQSNTLRQWEAAQKLKPARVSSIEWIAPPAEPGTPMTVHGTVVDPAGKPAAGVEILAYHTDNTGIYAAPGATDPWRLKGWAVTDPQGRFEFHTIRPAPYPGGQIAAHIHLLISTSCCGRQVAEVMFDDDPIGTASYRQRNQDVLWGQVTKHADGSQETSYSFKLKPRGDF